MSVESQLHEIGYLASVFILGCLLKQASKSLLNNLFSVHTARSDIVRLFSNVYWLTACRT